MSDTRVEFHTNGRVQRFYKCEDYTTEESETFPTRNAAASYLKKIKSYKPTGDNFMEDDWYGGCQLS